MQGQSLQSQRDMKANDEAFRHNLRHFQDHLANALNPDATSDELDAALDHPHWGVRVHAAYHPSLNKSQLDTALDDPSHYVVNNAKKGPAYKKFYPNGN
jgi:hypothetical protein